MNLCRGAARARVRGFVGVSVRVSVSVGVNVLIEVSVNVKGNGSHLCPNAATGRVRISANAS